MIDTYISVKCMTSVGATNNLNLIMKCLCHDYY